MDYALNHDFKYTNGSPIRYIAFPFPVAGQPQAVHHKYIFEKKDIVTGKPMMQAFIDALTAPLTENEKYKGPAPEPPPEASRFLGPDTEENLHQLFKDLDYTDYLPIVLPTEERVANMLKGTSHEPDEVIKTLVAGVELTENELKSAMERHGIRRLVVLSAYGVGTTWRRLRWVDKLFFRLLLKPQIDDTERQEQIVRQSDTDWVLARPVHLTDAADDATPYASTEGDVGAWKVSRDSVGRFLSEAVTATSYVGASVALSAHRAA